MTRQGCMSAPTPTIVNPRIEWSKGDRDCRLAEQSDHRQRHHLRRQCRSLPGVKTASTAYGHSTCTPASRSGSSGRPLTSTGSPTATASSSPPETGRVWGIDARTDDLIWERRPRCRHLRFPADRRRPRRHRRRGRHCHRVRPPGAVGACLAGRCRSTVRSGEVPRQTEKWSFSSGRTGTSWQLISTATSSGERPR